MSSKNKSKFRSFPAKRKNPYHLEAGVSGFLCTCNSKLAEKDCIRESYLLLSDFANELFGPETAIQNEPTKTAYFEDCDEDIDNALKNELNAIKNELKKSPEAKRFLVNESGANGIVFIRSTVPDPVKLAHTILTSLTKVQKTKYLLRLLPVELTCKAYIEDICTACNTLFDKHFSGEEKTFAVIYNHRHNDSIKREVLIERVAALVYNKNEKHKADLKQPQLAVLIEVIRSVCCISVVPDFYALKKYNLMELIAQNYDKKVEKIQKEGGDAFADVKNQI